MPEILSIVKELFSRKFKAYYRHHFGKESKFSSGGECKYENCSQGDFRPGPRRVQTWGRKTDQGGAFGWNPGHLGSGSCSVTTDWLISCRTSGSQSRVPGPALSTLPGNSVEMHILGLHPQIIWIQNSEGLRSRNLCFNKPPDDSDVH